MKYISLFMLLIFIVSCSGTKRIAETTPKETNEIVETSDSIGDNIKPVNDTIPKKIEVSENTEQVESEIESVTQNETETEVENISKSFDHNSWSDLLQKHVSNEGNVSYKGFKTDRKALLNYITSLSKNMPNETWSKNEKLAFWINAYNALTVDLILRHYPIESIKDIKKPWEQRYWKLGEKWYNLSDIEHQILRKMDEPRIHFAIVCASFSCPKLLNTAFEAANLEVQLTNATKAFINDPKRNALTPGKIEISKIFAWFEKDFLVKGTGSIINYINRYSNIKISKNTTKRFKTYDWALNE